MMTQLALEAGAYVLEDAGRSRSVFDLIGGDIGTPSTGPDSSRRNTGVHRRAARSTATDGLTVDFVVKFDRAQLNEIVQWVRDRRLRTNIGNVATLYEAVAAFDATARRKRKSIISVRSRRLGDCERFRPSPT